MLWQRFFQIPPPFRGFAASSMGAVYHPPRPPTKSERAPGFPRASWADTGPEAWVDAEGTLTTNASVPNPRPTVALVRQSPLADLTPRTQRRLVLQAFARLGRVEDHWALEPLQAGVRLNGLTLTTRRSLAHGDTLESGGGTWTVWFADISDEPDVGPGPLWNDLTRGLLSLDTNEHGLMAVWRGGNAATGVDSLARLRLLRSNQLFGELRTLELHVTSNEPVGDWSTFVSDHGLLARGAPFELKLRTPHDVAGASRLPAVEGPSVGAFGEGSKVTVSKALRLNGAPEPIVGGWFTVASGDALEVDGQRLELLPRSSPVPPTTHSQHGAPWFYDPTDSWKALALKSGSDGDWLLPTVNPTRWHVEDAGVRQRRADESLGPLLPPFTALPGGGFFTLRPSPFFSGQLSLPGHTEPEVNVFVDELLAAGDAAGELMALAARAQSVEAVRTLLVPFGLEPGPLRGGIDLDRSTRVGPFLSTVQLVAWTGLAAEIAAFLAHPLLRSLRRLVVTAAPKNEADEIARAISSARPDLDFELR
ncbi:MAG: hypothetical protein U0228_00815 [Myxococcaceae bacterium]